MYILIIFIKRCQLNYSLTAKFIFYYTSICLFFFQIQLLHLPNRDSKYRAPYLCTMHKCISPPRHLYHHAIRVTQMRRDKCAPFKKNSQKSPHIEREYPRRDVITTTLNSISPTHKSPRSRAAKPNPFILERFGACVCFFLCSMRIDRIRFLHKHIVCIGAVGATVGANDHNSCFSRERNTCLL